MDTERSWLPHLRGIPRRPLVCRFRQPRQNWDARGKAERSAYLPTEHALMTAATPPFAGLVQDLVDRQVHVRRTAILQLQSWYGMRAFDLFLQALPDQHAS